jgi:hypothetical protein
MSRFNTENASELAKEAFRLRIDDSAEDQRNEKAAAPLLGKEEKLLYALRRAEEAYEETLLLDPVRDKMRLTLRSLPRDCRKLSKHLRNALACWSAMRNYGGQYELVMRFPDVESLDGANELTSRIDETLQQLLSAAEWVSEEELPSYRGRPSGRSREGLSLFALEEFTKVLRAFWLEEKISGVFGFDQGTQDHIDDGERVATSAAARLIERAAKVLDENYDLGHVRQAMENVYAQPVPF